MKITVRYRRRDRIGRVATFSLLLVQRATAQLLLTRFIENSSVCGAIV